ncbi:hypothetical protein D3C72_1526070 [compost metagenome]
MRQGIYQFGKALQRRGRTAGQHLVLQQGAGGLPQGQLTIARRSTHFVQRPVANATGRGIYYALERSVVITVGYQPQIGQRILDFLTFEEALPAVNAVRHGGLQQCLFQHA